MSFESLKLIFFSLKFLHNLFEFISNQKKKAVFNSLLPYSIQLPFVKISVNTYQIFFSYNLKKKNNEEKYDILTIGCDKP